VLINRDYAHNPAKTIGSAKHFAYDSEHGTENLQHQRPSKADQDRVCVRVGSCGQERDGASPEDATKLRVNSEKVFEAAKRMGAETAILWAQEGESLIEIHPWQTAPPRA